MVLESWDNIYFALPYHSQESMALSKLQKSLTKLQNYSICESLIKSFETPESGTK